MKTEMSLSEKYPAAYFEHWLAMFCVDYSKTDEASVKEHIEIFKTFEGEEEFTNLQSELNAIVKNGDLEKFVYFTEILNRPDIRGDELVKMVEMIIKG